MLGKLWNNLSNTGVHSNHSPLSSRHIILTNRMGIISGIISLLILILDFISIEASEWTTTRILISISTLLFFSVIVSNEFGYFNFSKWLISWLPPILIVYISISDKTLYSEYITIKDFFSYRFLIFSSAIIPLLVFSTRNINSLIINLSPSFIGIVLFDFIHEFFGVGLGQFGFDDPNYFVHEGIIILAYLGLVGFLLNQLFISERFETKLFEQHDKLKETNQELSHLNQFINEQNHEIMVQSDELRATNEALVKAKNTIERQKILLVDQNINLEAQVLEKTKDLSKVTEELIINNNELRQFSHTLSHNLKSPVATCQGLLNLMDETDLNNSNKELFEYLNESVVKMKDIFSDLNEMLALRNKLYTSTDQVDLQKEIDTLHNDFYTELSRNKIKFIYNFDENKIIKTNAKRLNGILYQLISNSIKFRSDQRDPKIEIALNGNSEFHSIKIKDNGIGFDYKKFSDKVFYPYQKFNKHTTGKGLGLYLVKLQIESLGGCVKIDSVIDAYTEVEILLRK